MPLDHASKDVSRAAEAGERNRAPDGVGWTDIYRVELSDITYLDVRLTLHAASEALAPILPRVRKFYATAMAGFYSDVRDKMGTYDENAYAYGFDAHCFLKLDVRAEYVEDIWFEARTTNMTRLDGIRRAILAIDALAPSAIADYRENVVGAVADGVFFERYFKRLSEATQRTRGPGGRSA